MVCAKLTVSLKRIPKPILSSYTSMERLTNGQRSNAEKKMWKGGWTFKQDSETSTIVGVDVIHPCMDPPATNHNQSMKEEVNRRKHKEQQQQLIYRRLLWAVQMALYYFLQGAKVLPSVSRAGSSFKPELLLIRVWMAFPQEPQVVIVQDGLVSVKGREPKLGHLFFKSALGSHRLRWFPCRPLCS